MGYSSRYETSADDHDLSGWGGADYRKISILNSG